MDKQGREAKLSIAVDPTWRWRNFVLRVMVYLAANCFTRLQRALGQTSQQGTSSEKTSRIGYAKRFNLLQLALGQASQQATSSEDTRQLMYVTWQQQSCPHPREKQRKEGNQHEMWMKCSLCGARLVPTMDQVHTRPTYMPYPGPPRHS